MKCYVFKDNAYLNLSNQCMAYGETMPREFKKELTFSAIDEPPYDSVHYAVWTAADRYNGGDFHNFYHLPGNRFGILLGDVPETGEKGTMVSSNILFYMNQIIENRIRYREETGTRINPCRCVENINEAILNDPSFDAGMYPLDMATVNMETGKMKLVSAGMPHPIIRKKKGDIHVVECGSQIPVGIMPTEYHYNRIPLNPGDDVYFFTDGVTEAGARKGRPLDMDKFIECIEKTKDLPYDKSLEVIGRNTKRYALRHSISDELEDDITICGFRYLKRAKRP